MGIFDSKKSSTSITEIQENNFNSLDNKVVGDDSIVGGSTFFSLADTTGTSINMVNTDYGAIKAGASIANKSLDYAAANSAATNNTLMTALGDAFNFGADTVADSLSTVRSINNEAIAGNSTLASNAINKVSESYAPAGEANINTLIKWGAGAVAVIAVMVVLGKKYA